ncbi:MAG: carbamoyl-phosphate synthase L chain ATP-binding protein [Acidimicrobiia bacterium]|nr:carbamoyl-phosphate synthase L chain ATP-binding protein [Acidimicrobiia bacterium]
MSEVQATPLRTLLVANRGEIARRIFATARSMGLRCVAVYSDADTCAPFVSDADVAVHLPSGYLDGDAVVAAALRSGADAVHPGYGFLAENGAFARKVRDAGLTWIGPAADVIETMGDKIAAKRAAEAAGVPILPSTEDPADADSVGYPLLVKAAAGGGGKGMRLVERPENLDEAVAGARREAAGAFGDDRVFLERYVRRSRHIEIQILGDAHGTVIHLGERECSIQRRHQKIVEEAPSVRLDEALRRAMGSAAVALADSIGYKSAGTVEFLLDDVSGEYFFLEVNTRLQVEHPVTEEITGLDLVREQLLVAAGHRLTVGQADIVPAGHAIEVRLYAEDAANGFLPATGTVEAWLTPTEPAVRWDSGIEAGSVVGVSYDPMLAKVIAHGPTRPEAAGRLRLALERLHLGGLITNRDYLVAVLASPEFAAGDTTTDFIDRVRPAARLSPDAAQEAAVAAALWLQGRNRAHDGLWGFAPSNWRNAGLPAEQVSFADPTLDGDRQRDAEVLTITYTADRHGRFSLGSGEFVDVVEWADDRIELVVDGVRRSHRITATSDRMHVQTTATTVTLNILPRFTVPGSEAPTGGLTAPMPGSVVDVRCAVGDRVAVGQVLVVLEAMKMEHHVTAPFDGTVIEVPITVGRQVDRGTALVTIAEDGTDDGGVAT